MRRHLISICMVALAIGAALGFYLVSLRVSEERSQIAALQGSIARDTDDMRTLEATLHTRARLPELENWNRQVLAMDAPTPAQMLGGQAQLVSYATGGVPVPVRQAVAHAPTAAPRPTLIADEITSSKVLPGTGRGTARSVVEGLRSEHPSTALRSPSPFRGGSEDAVIAARVPVAEKPSLDDLTQAIGQELKAADTATDTPTVRHVSLR